MPLKFVTKKVGLIVIGAGMMGCFGESNQGRERAERQSRQYEVYSTPGKKVLVRAEDGEVRGKWRIQKSGWKVYGADRVVVGKIRPKGDAGLSLDGADGLSHEVMWGGENGDVTFPTLTLKQHQKGWLIYGKGSRFLGKVLPLEGGDVGLQFSASKKTPKDVVAKGSRVMRQGAVVLESDPSRLGALVLLPYVLEGEMSDLERAALGLWLDQWWSHQEGKK